MNLPRNTEPQVNGALANALKRLHPDWNDDTLHAERTNVIQKQKIEENFVVRRAAGVGKGKKPDILVAPPRRQPVIVETEFYPAYSVEQDALDRLGAKLLSTGAEIEGVLSVILPESLKHGDLDEVGKVKYQYAAHFLNSEGEFDRWPLNNVWLEGGIEEISDAIEFVSISPRKIATGTVILEDVVRNSASLLYDYAGEETLTELAEKLHQEPGEQTLRMVAAIFVSAFVFHAAIESQIKIPEVPVDNQISKRSLLTTWGEILKVNYWPVFSIAKDLLEKLPVKAVPPVMNRIADSISELTELGATSYHDLAGRMFQTLITDRKFLATFYTLPESACLLAELAVERLDINWSDGSAIEQLRIADFACGTGALLSAVQRSIYRRYRHSGGDDKDLHKSMMERVLLGFDIMPAATHLTCSILSSCYPSLAYGESKIHTMPYGIDGGRTHIGSLDLLTEDHSYSLFATGETFSGIESERNRGFSVTAKDNSCDIVIMNPPFTRPTNHAQTDVPVPSFAGFGKSGDEQHAMARKLKRSTQEFGHGNAGLASNFMDLGHRKLKDGGVLALVVPFTFACGKGWQKARTALDAHYSQIHVISIATDGLKDRAFSADTGMAECLIIATKKKSRNNSVNYSNIPSRPISLLESVVVADNSLASTVTGTIDDGGCAGVSSSYLIDAAQNLQTGKLILPRYSKTISIPTVELGEVANRGLLSRDINSAPPRGAFKIRRLKENEVPEYPALWNHDAPRERKLVVNPDSCGDVYPKCLDKAVEDWNKTASRLHWNINFRLNSQSLAMCLTSELCLGGSAWPNIIPFDLTHEVSLLLWSNTTLGLIMHWWKGTRQQSGRSRMQISAIHEYCVLDTRLLSKKQIQSSQIIFKEFVDKTFLPANEAYRDATRQDLDYAVLCELLQISTDILKPLKLLRDSWCAEPTVHGGKSTRIDTIQ